MENFLFPGEFCNVSLQVMSTWKARLTKRLKSPSGRMHPFPCSALLACFGNTSENASFEQPSTTDAHSTIYAQPMVKATKHQSYPGVEEGIPKKRQDSSIRAERNGSTNRNSSNHTTFQPAEVPEHLPESPDNEPDCEAVTFQTCIPRPSIIDMPKVSECFWQLIEKRWHWNTGLVIWRILQQANLFKHITELGVLGKFH